MFDVGLAELAVIAFVAVLALGPDKLPDLARQAAVMIRKFRSMADSARDELRGELGDADLQLRDLDPRAMMRKQLAEAMAELDAEEAAEQGRSGPAAPPATAPPAHQTLREGELPPWDPEAT